MRGFLKKKGLLISKVLSCYYAAELRIVLHNRSSLVVTFQSAGRRVGKMELGTDRETSRHPESMI